MTEDTVPVPNIGNYETVAKLSAGGAAQEDGYIPRKGKRKAIEYVGRPNNKNKRVVGRQAAVKTNIIDEDFLNKAFKDILRKKRSPEENSKETKIKMNPTLVTAKDE